MPNIKILRPEILKYLCRCFIVDLFNKENDSLRDKVLNLWSPTIDKWRTYRFDGPQDYIHNKLCKDLHKLDILDDYESIDNDSEGLSHMGDDLLKSYLLQDTYKKATHTHKFPFMTATYFWKQLYKKGLPKIYVSKKNLRWYIARLVPLYEIGMHNGIALKRFMKKNKPYVNSICMPVPLSVYKSHIHHD